MKEGEAVEQGELPQMVGERRDQKRDAGDDGHRGDDASPYPAGTRFRDDDGASCTSDQLSAMPISSHHYGSVVHSEEEYGIRDTSWIPPYGRIYRARTLSSVHLISDI